MKRPISIFFSFLILLSSGAAQLVIHICPEQGVLLTENDCDMHSDGQEGTKDLPECCKKYESTIHEDCCQEGYLFGISPKFGGVQIEKIITPFGSYLQTEYALYSSAFAPKSNYNYFRSKAPPDIPKCSIFELNCAYLI